MSRRRMVSLIFFVIFTVVFVLGVFYVERLYRGWDNVERISVDTENARLLLKQEPDPQLTPVRVNTPGPASPSVSIPSTTTSLSTRSTSTSTSATTLVGVIVDHSETNIIEQQGTTTTVFAEPPPDEDGLRVVLIIGNDSRPPFTGGRADVIMLAMVRDGQPPALVSLPRDLYIHNPCKGYDTRINANLNGCSSPAISGPTLLALAIEDYTGLSIDHSVMVGWEGFTEIVDAVGGIEICSTNPIRDSNSNLDLPAGCTQVDGDMAFAWVRSRKTQEYVDGSWRSVRGVSDLTRNQRQQELMIQLLGKLKNYNSPTSLLALSDSLAGAFVISDDLALPNAVALAWSLRGTNRDSIVQFKIPIANHRTDAGAAVLLPTRSFASLFNEAYPPLASD